MPISIHQDIVFPHKKTGRSTQTHDTHIRKQPHNLHCTFLRISARTTKASPRYEYTHTHIPTCVNMPVNRYVHTCERVCLATRTRTLTCPHARRIIVIKQHREFYLIVCTSYLNGLAREYIWECFCAPGVCACVCRCTWICVRV